MSTSVPSPNNLTVSSPYLNTQKVSEGEYNGYVQAQSLERPVRLHSDKHAIYCYPLTRPDAGHCDQVNISTVKKFGEGAHQSP